MSTQETPAKPGAPLWMGTFADLMSLLLAFFVLLFSFSELDRQKYKQVAGSMRDAFGVQRDIKAKESPRGINVVAREFSPGKPVPTPINSVRQFTTESAKPFLRLPTVNRMQQQMKADLDRMKKALKEEIDSGVIEVELDQTRIIVRINERGSFESGRAELAAAFRPVMQRMAQALRETRGSVVVSGHTDNRPIANHRFRSNWELSASRAVSVLHALIELGPIAQDRFELRGFAATRPDADNASSEGRARNRRVEVALIYEGEDANQDLPPDLLGMTTVTTEATGE